MVYLVKFPEMSVTIPTGIATVEIQLQAIHIKIGNRFGSFYTYITLSSRMYRAVFKLELKAFQFKYSDTFESKLQVLYNVKRFNVRLM